MKATRARWAQDRPWIRSIDNLLSEVRSLPWSAEASMRRSHYRPAGWLGAQALDQPPAREAESAAHQSRQGEEKLHAQARAHHEEALELPLREHEDPGIGQRHGASGTGHGIHQRHLAQHL